VGMRKEIVLGGLTVGHINKSLTHGVASVLSSNDVHP
jgi:hypothetical protein